MAGMADDIRIAVSATDKYWSPRKNSFKKWYNLIRLFNDLKQERMESVISSDPRTGYNMALWLLTPKVSSFVADTQGFTEEEITLTVPVQTFADRQLSLARRNTRSSIFGDSIIHGLKFMLITGWYAFFTFPSHHGWVIRAWNPASVFPMYDTEGHLTEVGRIYSIKGAEANRKIIMEGWLPRSRQWLNTQSVKIYNHWKVAPEGILHAVVMGDHLAKPYTVTKFFRIPIYSAPVAGLPDDGSIRMDDNWKAEVGQSVVAAVADVQKNYDKMLTYMQQLLRDTANPRYVAKTKGRGKIKPDDLFRRGALFELDIDEDFGPIPTPPIPGEMRAHQFDMRAMIQRGLFSDISFGNVVQGVSAFLMSQITASAKQILNPFQEALSNVLGDMATDNIKLMRALGIDMNGTPFDKKLPEDIMMDFQYQLIIPGDFLQRANAARIVNPNFTLSEQTVIQNQFPEVKDAAQEIAATRTERATRHPIFIQIEMIQEFKSALLEARSNNDIDFARLLGKAIQRLERELNIDNQAQEPVNVETPQQLTEGFR